MAFDVATITSWLYRNVLKTRERLPLFIISLHIYITHLIFMNYRGNKVWVTVYLSLMCTVCLLWELLYPVWATKFIEATCFTEASFATFYSLSRFINLVTVGLFATSGLPLTYLIPGYSQTAVVILISLIFVFNFLLDWIERKLWGDKYWGLLIAKRDELENKILVDLNKVNFDNVSLDFKTAGLVLPQKLIQIIDVLASDIKNENSVNKPIKLFKKRGKERGKEEEMIEIEIERGKESADMTNYMSKLFQPYAKSICSRIADGSQAGELSDKLSNNLANCTQEFIRNVKSTRKIEINTVK
jgi:hypothetical protein